MYENTMAHFRCVPAEKKLTRHLTIPEGHLIRAALFSSDGMFVAHERTAFRNTINTGWYV